MKLLKILKVWLDELIPEITKNCIRSKVAIVIKKNSNDSYNVILSEDYGEYLDLVEQKNNGKITEVEFNKQVNLITIDNLFTIKTETYNINDFVIIGFLDNKLTNVTIPGSVFLIVNGAFSNNPNIVIINNSSIENAKSIWTNIVGAKIIINNNVISIDDNK